MQTVPTGNGGYLVIERAGGGGVRIDSSNAGPFPVIDPRYVDLIIAHIIVAAETVTPPADRQLTMIGDVADVRRKLAGDL